jgi:small-conductance mechanosensitive channel
MKILKPKVSYIIRLLLTWTFFNFAANLLGLLITKLLTKSEYAIPGNIFNEFFGPILFQSLLFGLCFSITYWFSEKKNISLYSYVAIQFIVFHIILLMNLAIHNGLHFISSFDDPGLRYLSYSGQYLIDILYLYYPIGGYFDNGKFLTDNVGNFYLHWIFLVLVYYTIITWISTKTEKFLLGRKKRKKIQPKTESADL